MATAGNSPAASGYRLHMVRKKLQPRVLLDGLAMVESPRWHDDRLWFPHWGTDEIMAADLDGNVEVVAHGVSGMGQSIGWLPDGRMLETGFELMRFEPDGSRVRHVDLTHISPYIWSETTVDGRGNIYVNSIGFDFAEMGQRVQNAAESTVGVIALITPDGVATQVAGAIAFPNGMVITPDNQMLIVSESFTGTLLAFDIDHDGRLTNRRAWAEGLGPDGICMDADGAIWTSPAQPDIGVVRVGEDGEVLDEIELDIACFATGLGGPDGRTLFMMCNDFKGPDKFDEMIASRTAKVLIADAPAPTAGWP